VIQQRQRINNGNVTQLAGLSLRAFIQRPKEITPLKNDQDHRTKPAFVREDIALLGEADEEDNNSNSIEIDITKHLGPESTWPIDNDFFKGNLCILIRDHPNCNYNFDNETDVHFELQFQGKFLRKPKGPIYLAVELPQTTEYKVSWPLKAFLSASLAFIKSWGYNSIHMSYGGGRGGDTPHISTPAFQAFDRVVITPDGCQAPPLGYAIPENYADTRRRKNVEFNHKIDTSCTYTMSFNHTFVNVAEWRVYGIPVVKSFDFAFTRDLRVVIYEVEEDAGVDTDGDVQAVAITKIHRKREVAMWIHFQKGDEY